MKYYADTGFLLSLHLQETTSAAAAAIMQTVAEPLPVTPLVALEFRNALRLAVFRQTITVCPFWFPPLEAAKVNQILAIVASRIRPVRNAGGESRPV
jgi:hypothetical protein